MKTWNDYKDHVKTIDPEGKTNIEEAENLAAIVGAMIEQRNALGISQRNLPPFAESPNLLWQELNPSKPHQI
ncbi:MAG: hypothetical protein ACLRMZ_06995 [Blautia marasmi]